MKSQSASAVQAQKNKQRLGRWSLRGIALFFAATLWFYVLNSEPITVEKRLPIKFLTRPGLAVANTVDRNVRVRVKGPRAFIQNLFTSKQKAEVNLKSLSDKRGKKIDVEINTSSIPVPFGVDVLKIEPKELDIVLEKKITRSLPVRPVLEGELPPELHIVHQLIEPSHIKVSGPASYLKELDGLSTQTVDLSNLKRSGKKTLWLKSVDPRVEVLGEREVSFSYQVRPREANMTLKNVPIRFLTANSNFIPSKTEVALDILAPENTETSLRQSQVKVIGEIPPDAQGVVKVPLSVELPEGLFLLKVHPSRVQVKLP